MERGGVTRGGRLLASGALWQLTTTRVVFLFRYIDDILLTSVPFTFKSSSPVLMGHLTARGWLVSTDKT